MKAFWCIMLCLPLVHVAVHDASVVNFSIIVLDLLQRLTELLAVEVDCSVPAGVHIVSLILLSDGRCLLLLFCKTFRRKKYFAWLTNCLKIWMDSLSRISFVTFFLDISLLSFKFFSWKVNCRLLQKLLTPLLMQRKWQNFYLAQTLNILVLVWKFDIPSEL